MSRCHHKVSFASGFLPSRACRFTRPIREAVTSWVLIKSSMYGREGTSMYVTHAYVGYSYTQDLLSLKRMSVSVAANGVSQLITDCSTPLHVGEWEAALAHHLDQRFASFIIEGVRHGFRIGFGGGFPLVSSPCQPPSRSLPWTSTLRVSSQQGIL